jgi:hypothetical protein
MRKFIRNKKFILLIILFSVFVVFSNILAAKVGEQCNEISWPKSPAGTELKAVWVEKPGLIPGTTKLVCEYPNLTILVKYFYEWGIALGGLAVFISLIIGGFQYLTSMGEPARLAEAKDRIRSAFFGLILLLGSWLILNIINPQLTTFRSPEFSVATSTLSIGAACTSTEDCIKKCEEIYEKNPEECNKYIFECEIPPGQTEGVCSQKLRPCDYAVVWSEKNWSGTPEEIDPGKSVEFPAHSVKAYIFVDGNATETDATAGGCMLELMAGGWFDWGCGDRIATVPAYESDLYKWVDRPIKCVRLIKPQIK